jgi:MFS family permease
MYYLTLYSVSVLSYPRSVGSTLLAIYCGVNSIARIAMGILADKVGRQNTLIASVSSQCDIPCASHLSHQKLRSSFLDYPSSPCGTTHRARVLQHSSSSTGYTLVGIMPLSQQPSPRYMVWRITRASTPSYILFVGLGRSLVHPLLE